MKKQNGLRKIGCLLLAAVLLGQNTIAFAEGDGSIGGIASMLDSYISAEGDEDEITQLVNANADVTGTSYYSNMAISKVNDYVNVRSGPSTDDEIVGKIYDQCAAKVLSTITQEDGDWYHIRSGNVEGYIKSDYFVVGDEAKDYIKQNGSMYMQVNDDGINVRDAASPDSGVITVIYTGDRYTVKDDEGDYVTILTDDGETGYVARDYADLYVHVDTAMTLEEEEEMLAELARQAEEERRAAEGAAAWSVRQTIVDYCYSKVGCDYVWGAEGPYAFDCSGLVKLAYAQVGVYLYHQSGSQGQAGSYRSISEAQPGDILWQSGHVGIYVGNGLCIHASSPTVGVIISDVWSQGWVCARNVLG